MENIGLERAIMLARGRIDQLAKAVDDAFEILADQTKEIDQGWIFFFNTADFVRNNNPLSALAGNGPILVTREGEVRQLPSAIPWEDSLASWPRNANAYQ